MLFHPAVQNYGPTDERTDLPSLHGPLNVGVKSLPPLLYVAIRDLHFYPWILLNGDSSNGRSSGFVSGRARGAGGARGAVAPSTFLADNVNVFIIVDAYTRVRACRRAAAPSICSTTIVLLLLHVQYFRRFLIVCLIDDGNSKLYLLVFYR